MSGWLSNPAWGWFGPAYKAQKIHSGPGQMSVLNSQWSLEREAVSDERSGSFGDAPLGYSSSRGGHCPLTWVGSLSEMLNYHWSSAHPGSLGRLSGALHSDWLSGVAFLLLLLRDFLCFGWVEGAPGGSFAMASAGVSANSMAGRRGGGGAAGS